MSAYYKKVLKNIYLIILSFFALILYIAYGLFKSYAVEENNAKLQDLLMHNKALHTYVEGTLKPVIYAFQEDGSISKDFFNPKILSFTYISRHVMQEYNKQRENNNIEPLRYKIASDNPRNLINKANKKESLLLKKFNNSEIKKNKEKIYINGKDYIYYSMPVAKNKKSCMRCHSTPDKPPKNLVEQYGDKAGFGEKIGDIRAFISISMPLDVEMKKMFNLYLIFVASLSVIFIITLVIIYYFVKKLDSKDKILLDQANTDGLTSIHNRHKFNIDMEKYITSKREENIYLIIFDIDHFKNINDTYGHPVGDSVLKDLSKLITNNIRPTDMFYRIGGEEFAIISFTSNTKNEIKFANKIKDLVKMHKFNKIEKVTISLGCTKLIKGENSFSFYERCDKALYEAKEHGRDNVQYIKQD